MSNQNFVAPQGQIQGGFQAPQSTFEKKKRHANFQQLPAGLQVGYIKGVIDLGTQKTVFKAVEKRKRQVMILIEYPTIKTLFYEDDTELRPHNSIIKGTFFTGSQSKLREIINAYAGGSLTDKQAESFDFSKLLGATIGVLINHNIKDDGTVFANAKAFSPVQQNQMPEGFQISNERYLFYIDQQGNNFKTVNFASLPKWIRKQILNSDEAIEYASRGGQFAKSLEEESSNNTNQNQQQNNVPKPQQAQVPPAPTGNNIPNGYEWLNKDKFTYQQLLEGGWNDELLVKNGYMKKIETVPQPQAQVPPAPQAQIPTPPNATLPTSGNTVNEEQKFKDLPF